MALIKCVECNKEISDQALSCPYCGFPLKKNDSVSDIPKRVNVDIKKYELTSKKWKKILVFAVPLLIIGALLFIRNLLWAMMVDITGESNNSYALWSIIGFFSMIVGGILFLIAVIGHWWERG